MTEHTTASHPIGQGAAAIIAASAGCMAMGALTLLAEAMPSAKAAFTFWAPSGPLSGITASAILVWLVLWWGLSRLWTGRDVSLKIVGRVSVAMIVAALLLTFPPFMQLLK